MTKEVINVIQFDDGFPTQKFTKDDELRCLCPGCSYRISGPELQRKVSAGLKRKKPPAALKKSA